MNLVKGALLLGVFADKYILIDFLMAIRENVGPIRPCWVMTDDAEQYYSAWVAVFGLGPHKLLCTWHVDRAWRGAVNTIRDKETAALVYHNIRVLMEEGDENKFKTLLHKTMAQLGDSQATVGFAKYFNTHYVKRVEEWAACYRKSANINTNMYVESFHRILKYVYMKGCINKRIDNLIHILIKVSRDKAFERLSKMEKGKISDRLSTIRKRHWASVKLSLELVTKRKYTEWSVKSVDQKQEYIVMSENLNCPMKCQLLCRECSVCIHMYSCTCMDYIINHTICKHIHLVSTSETGKSTKKTEVKLRMCASNVTRASHHVLTRGSQHLLQDDNVLRKIKDRLHQTLSKIHIQMEKCASKHELLTCESHINSAAHILELPDSASTTSFPNKSRHPVNTCIQTQRFHSTRKRRRHAATRFSKPSTQEKRVVLEYLQQNKPLYKEKIIYSAVTEGEGCV